MPRAFLAVTLVAAALAGCGDRSGIEAGGRIPGTILTVHVLAPREGPRAQATRDLVRGAKLALAQAHGRVGRYTVQFAADDQPVRPDGDFDPEAIALAARMVVSDPGGIAVIGDLDPATAAISAPIFNAVGLLHISPISPQRFVQPARIENLFALGPTDAQLAQAIRARATPPIAVEAEPGGEGLARALGKTVPTARARTVVYAGDDPVNARGVIDGIRRENRRARIIVPPGLAGVDLGPRVSAIAPVAGDPPAGYAAAFGGDAPGPYAVVGYRAMQDVLAAIRRAGRRAQRRGALIAAFREN